MGPAAHGGPRRPGPVRHHRAVQRRPGGIAGLPDFLAERWEALEADFARYYHLDLTQACWGEEAVGVRRLHTLIQHLPRTPATVRALLGDLADWGTTEELLAATVDRLGEVTSLLHHAHFKPPHPDVQPVPRPGDDGRPAELELAAPPQMSSRDEIRAFFGGAIVVSDS